jgi:hypothetical protein
VGDIAIFLFIVAFVAVAGVGFGIVMLAPRIGRVLDRTDADEGPGDQPA